jgi:predicted nucleotidyltransferase
MPDLVRHVSVLTTVAATFPGRDIVVIGATALQWHFRSGFRGTLDLDLCVAIDLHEHARATLPHEWRRDPRRPFRWSLPDGQILDVLPASADVLANGELSWNDGTRLDLTGIDLAMRDNASLPANFPRECRVASRRALFVMKVAAWLDRPGDREKDLGDLALLLQRYVEDDDPRCFDDPAIDCEREFDERPAFLLGHDLASICSSQHRDRVAAFLARVANPDRADHTRLRYAGPLHWQRNEDTVPRILAALRAGLDR